MLCKRNGNINAFLTVKLDPLRKKIVAHIGTPLKDSAWKKLSSTSQDLTLDVSSKETFGFSRNKCPKFKTRAFFTLLLCSGKRSPGKMSQSHCLHRQKDTQLTEPSSAPSFLLILLPFYSALTRPHLPREVVQFEESPAPLDVFLHDSALVEGLSGWSLVVPSKP